MNEQAKALRTQFEAMDDDALKVAADERNIRGRHLIKNRATFVDKLVAHDSQLASIDPGAVEAGAAPQRGEGKRQVPSAIEQALDGSEKARQVPKPKLPPARPPAPALPPPPPPMTVAQGQQYVVRKDFPLHTGFSMTTLAKGSVVSLRTHSRLQEFVGRGLRLQPISGATHRFDHLGVLQVTDVHGDDDLDDDEKPDSGVDMHAFQQMASEMARVQTRLVTLEGERDTLRAELAAATALLDDKG